MNLKRVLRTADGSRAHRLREASLRRTATHAGEAFDAAIIGWWRTVMSRIGSMPFPPSVAMGSTGTGALLLRGRAPNLTFWANESADEVGDDVTGVARVTKGGEEKKGSGTSKTGAAGDGPTVKQSKAADAYKPDLEDE